MSTLVDLAKALAAHYHKDQKYGDKQYMYHLEKVAMNVKLLTNGTEDLLCIAYLHDILEDTDVPASVVYDLFGSEIFDSVCHVTKYPMLKNHYDKYIERVVSNKNALLVKYCDTLANLTASVENGSQGRIHKYTKQLDLLASYMDTENEPRQPS
jgi:(p)ppGpp synthase/HD superfamily hydrolase